MRTLFLIQPYEVHRHKLKASGALSFDDQEVALDAGRRMATARRGLVVLRQSVDGTLGVMGKPEVLAIHGRVPDVWKAAAKAA